jgi:hypothetical protein
VIQETILRVSAGAAAGLDDDRRLGFAGCFHDRLNLFHVVDVERANSVSTLCRFVQKLAHR